MFFLDAPCAAQQYVDPVGKVTADAWQNHAKLETPPIESRDLLTQLARRKRNSYLAQPPFVAKQPDHHGKLRGSGV